MKVQKDIHITITEGELELRIGKGLSTFAFKGKDAFVFRTAELKILCGMAEAGLAELKAYYDANPTAKRYDGDGIRNAIIDAIKETEKGVDKPPQ